ncbi:unnamed protein product [Lactuca saligna]|uniref:Uncharacterized protein n=1 Tax=Lactuca saligna TaxID=75948 RepID=A0AA35Y284_LACSI|nr:unnamed protein product [Lactuca saligna]
MSISNQELLKSLKRSVMRMRQMKICNTSLGKQRQLNTDKYMNGGYFQALHKLFLLLWLTGTTRSIHELAATSEHLLLGLHLLKTPSLRHAMLLMSQAL